MPCNNPANQLLTLSPDRSSEERGIILAVGLGLMVMVIHISIVERYAMVKVLLHVKSGFPLENNNAGYNRSMCQNVKT